MDDGQASRQAATPADFLREIWRKTPILIGVSLVLAALVGGGSWLLTPLKKVELSLLYLPPPVGDSAVSGGKALGSIGALLGQTAEDTFKTRARVVLQSDQTLVGFIESQHLMPLLFPKIWDSAHQRWTVEKGQEPDLAGAVAKMRDFLSINHKDDGTIGLSFMFPETRNVHALARDYVRFVDNKLRMEDLREAKASLKFMEAKSQGFTSLALKGAAMRFIVGNLEKELLATTRDYYAFLIVDETLPARKPYWPKPFLFAIITFILTFATGAVFVVLLRTVGTKTA